MKYIIKTYKCNFVIAPPGYYRRRDGKIIKDGTFNAGPEHGQRDHAFIFKSHKSASRVANKCSGEIIAIGE